ncbi:MAG: tetraacyldisaccharide 4'-kinase [Alteromonadaceae bacterium]|nr:tetraacyldisaccharide 4'-kinase [Alteromonadaceae bacterium]
MAGKLTAWVERFWYQRQQAPLGLRPFSALFGALARRRRDRFALPGNQYQSPLPVVVVGNITVGGTGKSPLTAWLVEVLRRHGYSPVIVTRGYGGAAKHAPLMVTPTTDVMACGDEALMLARQCQVPVVVDPDRARAAAWATAEGLGNILVCDDGLQHYRLARDIELAVFDGARGAGNGALLPAGPLREPLQRLASATAVIVNGEPWHPSFDAIRQHAPAFFRMSLQPQRMRHLLSGEIQASDYFRGQTVHGVAGIGNPSRFFKTLEALGVRVSEHVFPDHHRFSAADIVDDGLPVVMTAKDSVKCESFARPNWWVLEVAAAPEEALEQLLMKTLKTAT